MTNLRKKIQQNCWEHISRFDDPAGKVGRGSKPKVLFHSAADTVGLDLKEAMERVQQYADAGYAFPPLGKTTLARMADMLDVLPILPVQSLMDAFPPQSSTRSLKEYSQAMVAWLPVYIFATASTAIAVSIPSLPDLNADWLLSMIQFKGGDSFYRTSTLGSVASDPDDIPAEHVEFFEDRWVAKESDRMEPAAKKGRKNIVESLGEEVVDFIKAYVISHGQVVTADPHRLIPQGVTLGAPVRHIADALALKDPRLAASYSAVRKVFNGPRVNSKGFLSLVDAKIARHNRTVRQEHTRTRHCIVQMRYAEEFLSFLHIQGGFRVVWLAGDDKAKIPLHIPCLTYQKPSGYFMSDNMWKSLDHDFPLSARMLLVLSGWAICKTRLPQLENGSYDEALAAMDKQCIEKHGGDRECTSSGIESCLRLPPHAFLPPCLLCISILFVLLCLSCWRRRSTGAPRDPSLQTTGNIEIRFVFFGPP